MSCLFYNYQLHVLMILRCHFLGLNFNKIDGACQTKSSLAQLISIYVPAYDGDCRYL